MKLIFCPECSDLRKLHGEFTECSCGLSWGRYLNKRNATYGGKAVPFGVINSDIAKLVKRLDKLARLFRIEDSCPTFKREETNE